jgi:hypothetical protein
MTKPVEGAENANAMEDRHTAFGLNLSIDRRIAIAGLGRATSPLYDETPTYVRLDEGELQRRWSSLVNAPLRARELSLGGEALLTVDFAASVGYMLWAKDFGRVLISPSGEELLCEPDPENDAWANIVPAQALPLAATIRGLEVFHASGVVFDGKAVLFAGPPGAGKSSLAATFVREGAQLLSDDAVALELKDGALLAHAGSTVLQLRSGEDERLSEQARASLGEPTDSPFGKQRYVSGDTPDPAPLGSVFLLERSTDEPALERLEVVNPFDLIASTFNLSVRTASRLRNQLDIVSAIDSGDVTYRLRVQPHVDATELASIVRDALAAGSTTAPSGRDPNMGL